MNSKCTILVIEDNPDTLRLLGILTEESTDNLVLVTATTLQSAEEIICKQPIDLVYVDGDLDTLGPYPMPQTMELLRKYAPKFIGRIFSISSSDTYQEQMIAAGCVEAVQKNNVIEHALQHMEHLNKGYEIKEGSYLVTQVNGNANVYLGKVIRNKDKTYISLTNEGPYSVLPLGQCNVLSYETYMVQRAGTAGFNHIVSQHAKFTKPIITGLAEFGASGNQFISVPTK